MKFIAHKCINFHILLNKIPIKKIKFSNEDCLKTPDFL